MSAQRLKSYGLRVVHCFKGSNDDVIQDRRTKEVLHLDDEGPEGKSILVIKTLKISAMPNNKQVKVIAENIMKRNQSAMLSSLEIEHDAEVPMMKKVERIMM
jgi:hypothetical protein